MASIRKLKKDVNHLAYELLTEAFAYKHFHPDLDENKFDEVIKNIIKVRNDLVARINNPDESSDLGKLNAYYGQVKDDMYTMIEALENLKK